jgi:hypothetical protein
MIHYFSAYIADYLTQLMQSFVDLYPAYLQQAVFDDVLEENAVMPYVLASYFIHRLRVGRVKSMARRASRHSW